LRTDYSELNRPTTDLKLPVASESTPAPQRVAEGVWAPVDGSDRAYRARRKQMILFLGPRLYHFLTGLGL
jgi:hypothetical protein